jgi:tripartite-type tricarboxylate transporter receptor subunit TctC
MTTRDTHRIRAGAGARGLPGAALAAALGLALAAAAPGGARAQAESPAEFYKLKGLRLVVASGAGGGYDTYSRAFARHYERHLPGQPNIVVQNMPGASGITATNWLYNSAPKDGSRMLATYNALIDENLMGNPKVKFDVRKFNWIGSISRSQLICVTWKARSPYKSIEQMIGKPITVSATGRTGNSATLPLILNQLIGTEFQVIAGYSTTGSRLALERGEVDAICGLGRSTLLASNPDWFTNKRINVVGQVGLTKHPKLPDVPNVLDIAAAKDRDVFEFQAVVQAMGRPYVAPPEIPADRLKALRDGFDDTMKDPKFVAELERLRLSVSPLSGKEMEELIGKLYAYPSATIARISEILGLAATMKVTDCNRFTKDSVQCRKAKKKKKKSAN